MSRAGYYVGEALDRLYAWRHRSDLAGAEADAHLVRSVGPGGITPRERETRAFDREYVLKNCSRIATIEGRDYPYVVLPGTGETLCIHYSAFFGEDWSERRKARPEYRGWFHRLRMFWPMARHNFLFLCDTAGADQNGSYYKGVGGDFYVERAMDRIQDVVAGELGIGREAIVTLGSSMGANAAIRFALRLGYAGAVAVTPHIDLDVSARRQNRVRHVEAIVGRRDLEAPDLTSVMREIRELVQTVRPLPRLVVQSALDDHGVHYEQVVPLVGEWRHGGGAALSDFRDSGGHATAQATPDFFERAVRWCLVKNETPVPGE